MTTLRLKDFSTKVDRRTLPVYPVGTVLKVSKGVREARRSVVKHVLVQETESCAGCLFQGSHCGDYLDVRCIYPESDKGIIFVPCTESGETL